MHAFIALVRKDLLQYLVNRRAVLMSLLAPILIGAFFGSLFGGQDNQISQVPVAVTDLDNSPLSAQLLAGLKADPTLLVQALPAEAATQAVRAGKLKAAITVPAGFGAMAPAALFGGPPPELLLTVDPSQAMVAPLVRGMLTQQVMQLVSAAAFAPGSGALSQARGQLDQDSGLPAERRADLRAMFDSIARVQQGDAAAAAGAAPSGDAAAAAGVSAQADAAAAPGAAAGPASGVAQPVGQGAAPGMRTPFVLRERKAVAASSSAGYDGYAHAFAGMGVQFILLMGVDIGIGLLVLRRSGLWQRLRAAPLSRAQLLGSRMASCAVIACAVFGVIFAVAIGLFGVRVRGSVAGLLLLIAAFSLVTASFGLMIAAIGRTPETTRGLAILATLLLVMLGGAWVPSFIFPPWVQAIAAWTPTHWAVNGMDAMTWRGQPFSAALTPVAVLLAFAAGFAGLALARFRWDE